MRVLPFYDGLFRIECMSTSPHYCDDVPPQIIVLKTHDRGLLQADKSFLTNGAIRAVDGVSADNRPQIFLLIASRLSFCVLRLQFKQIQGRICPEFATNHFIKICGFRQTRVTRSSDHVSVCQVSVFIFAVFGDLH